MKRKNSRRLAAVMFTDIVGYTAMMQADERDANAKRTRHKKVLECMIGRHGGKILQYYGDGSLSTFPSAVEAVNCAVEIQDELQQEPKTPVRIGLHVGDIVFADDGIYGDGVNVASRVESLAAPGGVLLSDRVCDELKNHPEFTTLSMGEFELKNVQRPVELFALTNNGLAVPCREEIRANRKAEEKTIAVLPFINMSSDPENEYFSDGVTEEIINMLVKVDGLNVIARTSSFAFKGKHMDVREVGKALGVKTVLEGSVRKAGNKVRVTAQLIDTCSGFHIFSEDYDRGLEDIFAVQDEIALLIAKRLRENLSAPPGRSLRDTPPTENLEAYDLYLKGRHYINAGGPDDLEKAVKTFKMAIDTEPRFALPYVGLSLAYVVIGISRLGDPVEAFADAEKYALTAQKIDDNLAETHLALSRLHFWCRWDMAEARKSIAKALRMGPGSAEIHATYASFLLAEGNMEEALVEARIANNLDPLSPLSPHTVGYVYYAMERFDEAIEQCDKTLSVLPSYQHALVLKAKALLCAGRMEQAYEIFEKLAGTPNRVTIKHMASALLYSKRGDMDKVYECLGKVKEQDRAGTAEFLNWSYSLIYMAMGNTDRMFEYLGKCLEEKTVPMLFFRVEPLFKEYRDDPRYQQLIDKTFGA